MSMSKNLIGLPFDVVVHLFGFMTGLQIAPIRSVCKEWFRLVETRSLWRSVVYRPFEHDTQCKWIDWARVRLFVDYPEVLYRVDAASLIRLYVSLHDYDDQTRALLAAQRFHHKRLQLLIEASTKAGMTPQQIAEGWVTCESLKQVKSLVMPPVFFTSTETQSTSSSTSVLVFAPSSSSCSSSVRDDAAISNPGNKTTRKKPHKSRFNPAKRTKSKSTLIIVPTVPPVPCIPSVPCIPIVPIVPTALPSVPTTRVDLSLMSVFVLDPIPEYVGSSTMKITFDVFVDNQRRNLGSIVMHLGEPEKQHVVVYSDPWNGNEDEAFDAENKRVEASSF